MQSLRLQLISTPSYLLFQIGILKSKRTLDPSSGTCLENIIPRVKVIASLGFCARLV